MLTKPNRTDLEIRTMKVGKQMLRVGIKPGPGDVPPLLLFNGIGASLELASTFMQSMRNVKVIIFDVPGIGGSPRSDLPYRLPTIARLGADLVHALGHDEVDVAGVSWGGADKIEDRGFWPNGTDRRPVGTFTSPSIRATLLSIKSVNRPLLHAAAIQRGK